MKRKHVLMFFTDQQRYDTIHALGNDEIVTPALDQLSGDAILYALSRVRACPPVHA